jgi:predicted amidophosphoribosyltransferase
LKLPPQALTAPSLCPRCDSPAPSDDRCRTCDLPIRRCGSCHGIAGPFDRFCGFCGHELVLGERRSPAWRLWLAAALLPFALAIFGGLVAVGAIHLR